MSLTSRLDWHNSCWCSTRFFFFCHSGAWYTIPLLVMLLQCHTHTRHGIRAVEERATKVTRPPLLVTCLVSLPVSLKTRWHGDTLKATMDAVTARICRWCTAVHYATYHRFILKHKIPRSLAMCGQHREGLDVGQAKGQGRARTCLSLALDVCTVHMPSSQRLTHTPSHAHIAFTVILFGKDHFNSRRHEARFPVLRGLWSVSLCCSVYWMCCWCVVLSCELVYIVSK